MEIEELEKLETEEEDFERFTKIIILFYNSFVCISSQWGFYIFLIIEVCTKFKKFERIAYTTYTSVVTRNIHVVKSIETIPLTVSIKIKLQGL